jgi:hypothetical protein
MSVSHNPLMSGNCDNWSHVAWILSSIWWMPRWSQIEGGGQQFGAVLIESPGEFCSASSVACAAAGVGGMGGA